MPIDVLIVGKGAREHALAWKLKQSPRLGKLFIAPGNAGTALLGENVPIQENEIKELAAFAERNKIGLTVVGENVALALGIVDLFRGRKLRISGPSKAAARIESSKVFAKELMHEANIPTAAHRAFTDRDAALGYARVHGAPVVVKASGLAFGKGAYVCNTMEEVETALKTLFVDRLYGESGDEVIIEDFLIGPEVSIHALSDGFTFITFPPGDDNKRALDGDKGANTGGMGGVCPVPWVSSEMMRSIENKIIAPVLEAMRSRGEEFGGLLFPGVMITNDGPQVLEFNARFGDPETQLYMRLLKSDLLDLLELCLDHTLVMAKDKIEWENIFAVNVVVCSGGYPDHYEIGYEITGIEEAEKIPDVVVFHAGTKFEEDMFKTAGGRVLSISAIGGTMKEAVDRAYEAVGKIHFQDMHYRTDIGTKAMEFYHAIRT